jgi:hypothetical protein
MTDTDRRDGDGLDARLADLPRSIEPTRDLWSGIEARLEPRGSAQGGPRRPRWLVQAAAAVLLVAGSSLLTATLLDARREQGRMASMPGSTAEIPVETGVMAMPAAFGPGSRLDPEYVSARQQLVAVLDARMANLPASTRSKLAENLGELRRAAEQINEALDEQPGDPLLEELLLKTYQDELAVLANVNQLTDALGNSADPNAADEKRMQL